MVVKPALNDTAALALLTHMLAQQCDLIPAKITAPSTGFWNITLDVVTRRAISVTRKPALSHKIRIVRRTSTKLS